MNPWKHQDVTAAAFDILAGLEGNPPSISGFLTWKRKVAEGARGSDELGDLEFVDVEGGPLGTGRDDPHSDDDWVAWFAEDQARTRPWGYPVDGFNHFIDLRKGPGQFDDYDGYSYARGSASVGQHQYVGDYLAHDVSGESWGIVGILGHVMGVIGPSYKVDEALNLFFNDEYVHAPGHPWYRGCSPAAERYSFFADKGVYRTPEDEAKARFPLAESTGIGIGRKNIGIPYSVFMPVDNMARYWYERYLRESGSPSFLGPVMHAIQDASIPQHASGCMGNWQSRYERYVSDRVVPWLASDRAPVLNLLAQWNHTDPNPPSGLDVNDYTRTPATNWRVDQLVTWVALHAHRSYDWNYGGYQGGWQFDEANAVWLFRLAMAMSAHVLRMAAPHYQAPPQDPCGTTAAALERCLAPARAARHMLSRNITEAQREYYEEQLARAEERCAGLQEELNACRAAHPQ